MFSMRPRGGGPIHAGHGHAALSTTGLQFPQCAQEALIQVSKQVRLASHNKKRPVITQSIEWQTLIDNDVFCMTPDRSNTKLTALQQFGLLNILAKFFAVSNDGYEPHNMILQEKTDDNNKYAYFEVLFLGREGESTLHDHRINVLFQLASFSLQYPVLHLYMQISQWLSKVGTQKSYSEKFIEMIVDHFITPPLEKGMYQYLIPLENSCPEFTVFFLTYAPRTTEVTLPLIAVAARYMSKNNAYILNQFRDSPQLSNEFSKSSFPKLLTYFMDHEEDFPEKSVLLAGLLQIMTKWYTKVKDSDLDIQCLLDEQRPWSMIRCELLCSQMGASPVICKKVWAKILPLMPQIPEDQAELMRQVESSVMAPKKT